MKKFCVTNEEYELLDKKFGKLCCKAAWNLMGRNTRNNHDMDVYDVISEIRWHMVKAGMYYKRQTYIEDCLSVLSDYCKNKMALCVVEELCKLWGNRKKHGASKRKFGDHQEEILDMLVKKYVPVKLQPDVNAPLKMDRKFEIYCKSIIWNSNKALGKKITKESSIRIGMISISDKDFVI